MKAVSSTWTTFVNTHNTFVIADLYTIIPQDGSTTLRWTSGDTDLMGYSCAGPIVSREGTRQTSGGETATLTITLGCGNGVTLPNGKKITLAASESFFDGAKVGVDRLFMPTWGDTSLGLLRWFTGFVADVQASSTEVVLGCKSGVEYLRQLMMPRRLFQAQCPHDLYGAACGAAKNPVAVTVASGSTTLAVVVSGGGNWDLGTLQFTSGQNSGLHRQIASTTPGSGILTFALTSPLPYAPAPGDTATLLAGCDKSFISTHGCSSFSNEGRFGGFIWIPRQESIR